MFIWSFIFTVCRSLFLLFVGVVYLLFVGVVFLLLVGVVFLMFVEVVFLLFVGVVFLLFVGVAFILVVVVVFLLKWDIYDRASVWNFPELRNLQQYRCNRRPDYPDRSVAFGRTAAIVLRGCGEIVTATPARRARFFGSSKRRL